MFTLTNSDRETYQKLAAISLPRHTSYPPAPLWNNALSQSCFLTNLAQKPKDHPIGLYVHIPYCRKLCLYCGCARTIVKEGATNDPTPAFLAALLTEIESKSIVLKNAKVSSLHLGGGTPTFLKPKAIK